MVILPVTDIYILDNVEIWCQSFKECGIANCHLIGLILRDTFNQGQANRVRVSIRFDNSMFDTFKALRGLFLSIGWKNGTERGL